MLSKLEEIGCNADMLHIHNSNLTEKQKEEVEKIRKSIGYFRNIKSILNEIYLEYFNNYLTIEKFASDEEIDIETAKKLIEIGKKINNMEI